MPSFFAVFALTSATLSQVIFVRGFGSSCNQPLFPKRPSKMVESVRKTSSYVLGLGGWVLEEFNDAAQSDFSETVFVASAVLGTNPSCRHLRHHDSKSVGAELATATRSLPLPVPTPWAVVPDCPRQ